MNGLYRAIQLETNTTNLLRSLGVPVVGREVHLVSLEVVRRDGGWRNHVHREKIDRMNDDSIKPQPQTDPGVSPAGAEMTFGCCIGVKRARVGVCFDGAEATVTPTAS